MTYQEPQSNTSDDRLKEFARTYKEEFKEDISISEARAMLSRLEVLIECVRRPLPPDPKDDSKTSEA